MKIVEQFNSIQGEGKYTGVPSHFIRTTGCNLRCAWSNPDGTVTKCDTPYTSWNPEGGKTLDVKQTLDDLAKTEIRHIVITGGEPMLQHDINDVAEECIEKGYTVTIETNGTVSKKLNPFIFMSFSPKLKSSYPKRGDELFEDGEFERAFNMHSRHNNFIYPIKHFLQTNPYQLKFVVNGKDDLDEILQVNDLVGATKQNVYIMPQGITTKQFDERQKEIFDICMENGFTYSTRLHIDLFGNRRGI